MYVRSATIIRSYLYFRTFAESDAMFQSSKTPIWPFRPHHLSGLLSQYVIPLCRRHILVSEEPEK